VYVRETLARKLMRGHSRKGRSVVGRDDEPDVPDGWQQFGVDSEGATGLRAVQRAAPRVYESFDQWFEFPVACGT
jgi:hypothetical protein